jgi:hypothetical protein
MYIFIENPRTAVSMPAIFLLASLIIPPQLHAQDEQSVTPTFEETHALITTLILDKQILQNHWHQMDFPQYNHFDDAVWSITMYSGDECEITYRRKFEISHKSQESVKPVYGDKPATIIGHKTAKFDMANIETIEIHDFGDSSGRWPGHYTERRCERDRYRRSGVQRCRRDGQRSPGWRPERQDSGR